MGRAVSVGLLWLGRGTAGAAADATGRCVTASAARRAAEAAARGSYGKLLAILAARTRDIAAAEDALADAFAAALAAWEATGVPANPDAWLLTAARNRLANRYRHALVQDAAVVEIERRQAELGEAGGFPDERLKLLFVCGHPAIDPAIRAPLMLQTVLGLDSARIADAFLVAPAAMAQRLVRAKTKIRAASLRFETPEPEDLADRLSDVLDAVYAAFGTGWDAIDGADERLRGLAEEGIYLGRLLVALLPDDPEAKGLLSLMLFCHARRAARRGPTGAFVPLSRQDHSLWDAPMIAEADALLGAAAKSGVFGRYQCEAAIQSVHAQRPIRGILDHDALEALYGVLAARRPSLGVLVAQAASRLEAGRAAQALAALDELRGPAADRYQPYWVARWRCLEALGRDDEAKAARRIAIGLTEHPAVRDYLLQPA
jgi:RNA polymerase sigma-70 factor, ECF subfamily